jgi:hypothetical protein
MGPYETDIFWTDSLPVYQKIALKRVSGMTLIPAPDFYFPQE